MLWILCAYTSFLEHIWSNIPFVFRATVTHIIPCHPKMRFWVTPQCLQQDKSMKTPLYNSVDNLHQLLPREAGPSLSLQAQNIEFGNGLYLFLISRLYNFYLTIAMGFSRFTQPYRLPREKAIIFNLSGCQGLAENQERNTTATLRSVYTSSIP